MGGKSLLDIYEKESYRRGLKTGTVRAGISACSGLLLVLQSSGFQSLKDVTERDVLNYFSRRKLSSSTKVNIASVFEAQTGSYFDSARRILTYLPNLHRRRKNIQYLTEEETQAIRSVLSDSENGLCLRNRAIGTILYFTGMRSSDVAALKFSDIDWEREEIRIVQKKTGEELLLPLTAAAGNAIFEYATQERPNSTGVPMVSYQSGFADLIEKYVFYQESSGSWSEVRARNLRYSDRFCAEHFPDRALCQEMVDVWCQKRDTETKPSCITRTGVIRSFISYLQKRGMTDVLPMPIPKSVGKSKPEMGNRCYRVFLIWQETVSVSNSVSVQWGNHQLCNQ